MARREFIVGNVTDVIDGETLCVTVERNGGRNTYEYKEQETIKINKIRMTNIAWMTGVYTKSKIEKMFKGKKVLCLIESKDLSGNIMADVQLVN